VLENRAEAVEAAEEPNTDEAELEEMLLLLLFWLYWLLYWLLFASELNVEDDDEDESPDDAIDMFLRGNLPDPPPSNNPLIPPPPPPVDMDEDDDPDAAVVVVVVTPIFTAGLFLLAPGPVGLPVTADGKSSVESTGAKLVSEDCGVSPKKAG
jgi:hypothetical protein